MFHRLRSLFALAILVFAGEAAPRAVDEWQRLGWVVGFERGLEQARVRNRPAFVYFDAAWCSWCHRYQAETLDESSVRAVLARDFVPVVVDYDARPDLVERYRARGLPYTLILAPDGRVLNGFAGILSAPDLLDVLARTKEGASPRTTPSLSPRPCVRRGSIARRTGDFAVRSLSTSSGCTGRARARSPEAT